MNYNNVVETTTDGKSDYQSLIERIKTALNSKEAKSCVGFDELSDYLEEVIPELKETFDEKMFRELRHYIIEQHGLSNGSSSVFDMVKWLDSKKAVLCGNNSSEFRTTMLEKIDASDNVVVLTNQYGSDEIEIVSDISSNNLERSIVEAALNEIISEDGDETLEIKPGEFYLCIRDLWMENRLIHSRGDVVYAEPDMNIVHIHKKIAPRYFVPLRNIYKKIRSEWTHEDTVTLEDILWYDYEGCYSLEEEHIEWLKNLRTRMEYKVEEKFKCHKGWSVADAKEGDIIYRYCGADTKGYQYFDIFILKSCSRVGHKEDGKLIVEPYALYDGYTDKFIVPNKNELGTIVINDFIGECAMATAEQTELFLSKLEENGYRWDSETKTVTKYSN